MVLELSNLVFVTVGIAVLIILFMIVLKYRKTMAQNHDRLDNIPSQVYTSKYGDIEYLLRGEGPTIVVSMA